MIPHILGSKPVVEAMEADLKPRVELLRQQGIVPKLAIVRVGANPDDLSYERMAIKRAESLDIAVQGFDYPENVDPELVAGDIRYINEDASIHGCLMFRPLPEYMDEQALCNMLVPHKDVDGISVAALGGIFIDDPDALPPATAEACIKVLDHYAIPLQGKRVVVVGRSLVIGKPVSMILLRHNASVTICHSKTCVRRGIFHGRPDRARRGHQLRCRRPHVRRCRFRGGRADRCSYHASSWRDRIGHYLLHHGAHGSFC